MATIQITSSDQGGTVTVNPGDLIVIRLAENITTGYEWEVARVDGQFMELVDSTYAPIPMPGVAVGGGGMRTLRFRTKALGSGQIQLRLRRPWEAVDAAVEHFAVNIQVQ